MARMGDFERHLLLGRCLCLESSKRQGRQCRGKADHVRLRREDRCRAPTRMEEAGRDGASKVEVALPLRQKVWTAAQPWKVPEDYVWG